MVPIVKFPEIISHYSLYFKEVFRECEYEHFKKYASVLMVSENKTVEAINRLFVLDVQDQSSLNRFLTNSKYRIAALHRKRLELLNSQAETQLKSNGANVGVLSLDDTLLTHYGREFEGLTKLFDHSTQTYVWAHNLVNLHYSDDQTDYPISFELWKPVDIVALEKGLRDSGVKIKEKKEPLKESEPDKWRNYLLYLYRKNQQKEAVRKAYRSKIVIGQELLRDFFNNYPTEDLPVSFDKWFTSPTFCRYIDQELKKSYVGGLKSDEEMLLAGSVTITVGDFVKRLKEQHLDSKCLSKSSQNPKSVFVKTTINYKGKKEVFYNYCQVHHIKGYGQQNLLISHQKEDLSDSARVFISNRLNWRVQHITRVGRNLIKISKGL